MPRKKPTSTRQKKEQQQLKRAVKRGEVEPPPKKSQNRKKRPPNARSIPNVASESSRRLHSSFIKTSSAYLKRTQELASVLPLHRPIPAEASILADQSTEVSKEPVMTCPARPKWNYDMSKKEVEHNEEGWFKKWLNQIDELASNWQMSMDFSQLEGDEDGIKEPPTSMPPGRTCFERNLEVWRQLWRVTEMSDIVLVLLDSRCPSVHLPPSLVRYLSNHQVILVLTKTDICGPLRVAAWKKYLHDLHPQFPLVEVSSYAPKDQSTLHQGRTLYEPYLPSTFRRQLVDAIKNLCIKLLEPPENVKPKPAVLKQWRPKIKRDINWEDAYQINTDAGKIIGGAAAPLTHAEGNDEESPQEPPFLTIGLIGQPNVGKSSLLNALFGENRVRASKTPGKTKHFQTLFWTSDIRLVDCPGLVIPNYMPMEMQVLCGILPIARLSAIPACVHFAAQLLPLEKIFRLTHPSALDPPPEDKRTWREGMKRSDQKVAPWTAMDILVAYATKKCWFTSQAGRPDIHRAGNAILRALAENKIPWAFWPPGTSFNLLEIDDDDKGLWIPRDEIASNEEESSSEDTSDTEGSKNPDDGGTMVDETEHDSLSDEEDNTIGDDDRVQLQAMNIGGRFALLEDADDDED